MEKNKTGKKKIQKTEIVKKTCPFCDLDCPDCRMYEMTDRGILRCVFFSILDCLNYIKLNLGGMK